MTQRYNIRIVGSEETFSCSPDVSVLRAMELVGRTGIPVGCRGGGCGVCKIIVVAGEISTRKMSRAHISEKDEANRTVLACRTFAKSDLLVEVVNEGKVRAQAMLEPGLGRW